MRAQYLLFLLLSGLFLGCTSSRSLTSSTSSPVVARIGDRTVTLEELQRQYARANPGDTLPTPEAYEAFLRRYVDLQLKILAAREAGVAQRPEVRAELETYRRQLAQPYLIDREIIEPLARELYARQQEEVDVSHILLRVDELALPEDTLQAFQRLQAIRDSIVTGALTFEEAARRYSEDPSARQNGGHLGYLSGGQVVYPFETMAYTTPVGEVSPVFRTRFGYHILKVHDRRQRPPDVHLAQIFIRKDPDTPVQRARALADSLYTLLHQGASFEELAREYSEDPTSAFRGGDIGFVPPSRLITPLQEAIADLDSIGAISPPVETPHGFHILRYLGRREAEPYEAVAERLKKQVSRLPRAMEARLAAGARYRQQFGSKVDSALVLAALDSLGSPRIFSTILHKGFPASLKDRPFAFIGDEPYTLADLEHYIRERKPTLEPRRKDQFFILVDRFLNEKALDVAAATLEARNPEFAALMEEYRNGILVFQIMQDSVWDAAMRDTTALRAYFKAHREDFWYPERHQIISYFSTSDTTLRKALALLPHTPVEGVQVDTLLTPGPTQSIYDRALTLQPGAMTEPLPYRDGYIVLRYEGKVPARPKTFEEARAEVIGAYQKVRETEWLNRLRTRYPVTLYPERLHTDNH